MTFEERQEHEDAVDAYQTKMAASLAKQKEDNSKAYKAKPPKKQKHSSTNGTVNTSVDETVRNYG